jgi:phage N-6-adenine-methyltransferase
LANDEWITQPYIFNWIQKQLPFEMILDLAATLYNSKCLCYLNKEADSLKQDWLDCVNTWCRSRFTIDRKCNYSLDKQNLNAILGTWCNPPYSKPNLPRFTEKACLEAEKGLNQCFLVPLDITGWSRDFVWGQAEVLIPDERIAFIDPVTGGPQDQPPKGSMIVIYGPTAQKGLIKPVHIPKPDEN